ncbi:MAG: transcription antitermination factor NusB [Candidatus Omnitrophica bacterium]|nr:transcription antitermination factor NusB [Candidatus Omnitrophota bacterium]
MRKRTKARELALQVLFQIDITGEDPDSALKVFLQNQIRPIEASVSEFCQCLIQGTTSNMKKIDEVVSRYAMNWLIKRMAVIDRNILRMATYEIIYLSDIPVNVSINEAVDLAKKFGDIDSGKFVNGILDKISKSEKVNKNSAKD